MSNINNIKCGCKTCISAILLQSDLNKWRLLQLAKLGKLCINYESNRLLQRSKINFIEYNNKIFPDNSRIYLRACDAESSYHCLYPNTGSNIPK